MARLDARWDNFWERGQAWYGFWQDGPAGQITYESAFTADAVLGTAVSGSLTADALVLSQLASGLTSDAVLTATTPGSFSGDAVVRLTATGVATLDAVTRATQPGGLTTDAILLLEQAGSFATDAVLASSSSTVESSFPADAFVLPWFTLDAELASIWTPGTFTVDTLLHLRKVQWFQIAAAFFRYDMEGSFPLEAVVWQPMFTADAIIGTVTHPYAYFRVRAWLEIPVYHPVFEGDDGVPVDAWIEGFTGEQFSIDAAIVGLERLGSFTLEADIDAPDEQRGTFTAGAWLGMTWTALFNVEALIVQAYPFTIDAIIMPAFTVGAWLTYLEGAGAFQIDAVALSSPELGVTADAVVVDDLGSFWGFWLDAQLAGTVYGEIEVLAHIVGTPQRDFTLSAYVMPTFTADAFIQPYFTVGAYIMGTNYVVFPPSQEGSDGEVRGTSTFYAESGEFDPTMVGQRIVIDGVEYTITAVIDDHTITVTPVLEASGHNIPWYIPSGSPTDPLGDDHPPVITRRFQVAILWSRPDAETWNDMTPDVMWAQTEFTQSARSGPGTFRITLRGSFPQYVGGEEIHVEIDDFRVFGGYVTQIEKGYVFPDAFNEPLTTLIGVDYNVMFDRLVVYNASWDRAHNGTGEYRNWKPFPKGSWDDTIIKSIVTSDLTDLTGQGFDLTSNVDRVEQVALEVPWTMQAGTTWRTVMQSISMVTTGVWWINAYKELHYHSRDMVTAPWPITDGDGGISSRNLKISSDIGPMISDAFVWGTLAYTTAGEIMLSRQPADSNTQVDYWERKIAALQPKIDRIMLKAPSKRTAKEKANLAAYKKTLAVYLKELRKAQAAAVRDAPQGVYGRWQYGEFRNDIHHQSWLDRRATSIYERYSVPVVKAEATIFDPGFSAGMVAEVVSSAHGVADELVIRQMTLRFVVGKEPFEGRYYAVPQYDLVLGLDPEAPWNIYDYLPWPSDKKQRKFVRTGKTEVQEEWLMLDTFSRTWGPDEGTLGIADNDREEERWWYSPGTSS